MSVRSLVPARPFRRTAGALIAVCVCAGAHAGLDGVDAYFGNVAAVAVQADGKTLLGGDMDEADTRYLRRVDRSGRTDAAFAPSLDGALRAILVQTDGRILVGGNFMRAGGEPRHLLARFETDGRLDASFATNAEGTRDNSGTPAVDALVQQGDGRVLVGGRFNSIGGQPHRNIARLEADGRVDASFQAAADTRVETIAVQADGRILIGGAFTFVNNQPRAHVARLKVDGRLDETFRADVDQAVFALAWQADGRVLIGGRFGKVGGQARSGLARLGEDGRLDAAFDVALDRDGSPAWVRSLLLQADGRIMIGGDFERVDAHTHRGLARLFADGRVDEALHADTSSLVLATALRDDGAIVIGGDFIRVNAFRRPGFAIVGANDRVQPGADDPAPGADKAAHAQATRAKP